MAHKTVGNTIVEWDDSRPFIFTMREASGPAHDRRKKAITIDLFDLREGFEDDFLLHLKEFLIFRRQKLQLTSIKYQSTQFRSLFQQVSDLKLFDQKVSVIDESFLLVLSAVKEELQDSGLTNLKRSFAANPYAPLFAAGLNNSDFPLKRDKKGLHGQRIDNILGKALTRAACIHILSRCEQAYDIGEMDIGHFAFANLAFAVFCRPMSYRQICLDDLRCDEKSNSFFLYIIPAKTGVHHPEKICYSINQPVGVLLQKLRQHIVTRYGYLVDPEKVGKLALFPARRMKKDKSGWVSDYSNHNFGMLESSGHFTRSYATSIKNALKDDQFSLSANVLRHTVGTQLALAGASAQTIKAVLKHSSDTICQAYVDIAFKGLINELSDAMQPAFQSHIPAFDRFRSKTDPVTIDKAIRSEDLQTGQIELNGECGKQIQCEHAPIVCYGCHRFIPCWDADHSVNLNAVQREIDDFKQRGKSFQHMVQKAQAAKYQIIFVINTADRHRQAMAPESCP